MYWKDMLNVQNVEKGFFSSSNPYGIPDLKPDEFDIKELIPYRVDKNRNGRRTKAKMSMDSTVSDLKYNLRRGVESDGYISNSDFRVEDYGNSVSVQIRYLGKWKNPSHARYEEDYDWQELRSSSGKQIDKVIKKMSKQSGRKITWSTSEKNWIDIDIPKMKGD